MPAYRHPMYSISDLVSIVKRDERGNPISSREGFVMSLKPNRHADGGFASWSYVVEFLDKAEQQEVTEDLLEGRYVVSRQYTKKM